ncbi:3-oxoadipate enol-lactonase 2 [Buttiauxella agrestis]|uniref:3-oxoadipate enol-lactonase 2 n=1 Tax=Buttiauxella agrestis TaxID=82977 RepID=A0A381CAS5_9ENTR|nr:3-oxoadipate enol-lactonase [Buttiauxella agrestis]SUW64123.1 3-oxoadipate enol-lactonase 2 [Buttiauxella agrestis]
MSLYYQLEGRSGAPVVVLSNSLGTTLEMWQPQMAALLENFRVLRYDTHGHGRTTKNGKTTLPQLAEDIISVMDDAGVKQAHFCGISMGGLTGLWLARFTPERFLSVTVANSAAKVGEQSGWLERARTVRHDGMAAIANSAPQRWFTEDFVKHHHSQVDALCETLAGIDAEGYASCCEALAAADLRGEIGNITLPMQFIAGASDPVCSVADSEFMHQQIHGSHLVTLESSHLSNVGDAHGFNVALLNFIQQDD